MADSEAHASYEKKREHESDDEGTTKRLREDGDASSDSAAKTRFGQNGASHDDHKENSGSADGAAAGASAGGQVFTSAQKFSSYPCRLPPPLPLATSRR